MLRFLRRSTQCEIDDLNSKGEARLPATSENMRASLAEWGIIVFRNAFPASAVSGLVEAAIRHGEHVASVRKTGSDDFGFGEQYRFSPGPLSCEITAIDPETANCSTDFHRTSIWHELSNSPLPSILNEAVKHDAWFASARARVVIPGMPKNRGGRIPLHLERRAHPYEGVHNVWTPLIPEGSTTNIDMPGLQLFAGRQDFFRTLSAESEPDILAYMSSLRPQAHMENPPGDEHGFFLRPRLKTGDAIIFSGFVPHAGYEPPGCTRTRVCFDMRVFPGEQRPEKLAQIPVYKLNLSGLRSPSETSSAQSSSQRFR